MPVAALDFFGPVLRGTFRSLVGELAKKESWIKAPIRDAQIDQFLSPETDIFPKSDVVPSAATLVKGRTVRSLGPFRPQEISLNELSDTGSPIGPVKFSDEELPKKLDSSWVSGSQGQSQDPLDTLGHFITSIGKDKRGYYVSIFDSWDFDQPGAAGAGIGKEGSLRARLGEKVLRQTGTPFYLYDRFYFEPERAKDGSLTVPRSVLGGR